MGREEISQKTTAIKADLDNILRQDDLEPCIRICAESALAHINLLYIELGLDVQ